MSTPDEIRRQLDLLDAEFGSDENSKSGRLQLAEFTKRRAALLKRLRDQENAPTAPPAAPALSVRELDAIFYPPKIPNIPADDVRELAAFKHSFNEAITAGDAETAREILKTERRQNLSHGAHLSRVAAAFRDSFKNSGAKSWPALIIGALAVLFHEIDETRMRARIDRAARTDAFDDFDVFLEGRTFTFALRCGDRTIKRTVKAPIPLYRGTWSDGTKAEHSDVFTMGGSLWIAKCDTDTRPPSSDWQQCVRGIRS